MIFELGLIGKLDKVKLHGKKVKNNDKISFYK